MLLRVFPSQYNLLTHSVSLRVFQSALQSMPWGTKASLEQQVAELKVNTEVQSADSPTDKEDGQLIQGITMSAASQFVHSLVSFLHVQNTMVD